MNPITCIIIEDEPEFVDILNFYLKKIPEVRVLSNHANTDDAAQAIELNKPNFVFLDMNISGEGGPDFIQKLAYQPKVIIVSGHSESFMEYYPEVSYVDFLQKPPTLDKLKQAIERCQ